MIKSLARASRAWITVSLLVFVLLANILARPISVQAFALVSLYDEIGDAGNTLSNPQFITGGPYDGIFADMDDISDTTDVFAFHWMGGDFLAEFTSDLDPEIALYTFSQTVLGSVVGTNNFSLQIPNVPAGNYLFSVSSLSGPPPFGYAVFFTSSAGEHPISAVPEPSTVTLMALGLAGLGWVRQKHKGNGCA